MSATPANAQDSLACSYASVCAGCDWLLKSPTEQRRLKIQMLRSAWLEHTGSDLRGTVEWIAVGQGGLRDRVDLMFDRSSGAPRLGLFDRFRTGLVDLQGCPQMSPALEAWFRDFRRFDFPIRRGSVRLRVSPSGARGVWLDFANVDVKELLSERTVLDALRRDAIVEIGQRRKRLVEREGELKLADPVLEPWFETYSDNVSIPLYCTVGSFTQPGFRANRALVSEVMNRVRESGARRAGEFGSGIGNFTLPLATVCETVDAFEVDTLALEGLRRSLKETSLEHKVEIHSGDYQIANKQNVELSGLDLLLVDPPRSGLKGFLDPVERLASSMRPQTVVYVSCFADSFSQDARRLIDLGYDVGRVAIVDQFPQSRHFEIVASFSKRP